MDRRPGINSQYLKNKNRGKVLQYIATGEYSSRIEIANNMRLTKMTVTNIVAALIADGYVIEIERVQNNTAGRSPITLGIAADAPKVVSVYISRGGLSAMLVDLNGKILKKTSAAFEDETPSSMTGKLYSSLDAVFAFAEKLRPKCRITGIGVASIGPIDVEAGEILNPRDFFGITKFPVASILRSRYKTAVFINNDMNASATAEKLYGEGRGYDDFLYIGLTKGIGLGMITGGRLFQNNSGYVGEIGHMTIDYNGELCSCGRRGCLETYANIPVVIKRLEEASGESEVLPSDFERLYKKPECAGVFAALTEALAVALTNAVNLLDPQCIFIGAEGAYFPSEMLNELEAKINATRLATGYRSVRVRRSSFGPNAALLGSACCVWRELFEGHIG